MTEIVVKITDNERVMLECIEMYGQLSPRDLEENHPLCMSKDDARIAMQGLFSKGLITLDDEFMFTVAKVTRICLTNR